MNIRLDLQFDGHNYFGWQYQPNRTTVQGELEAALQRLTGTRVKLIGVGRTDAGVSAISYTANFVWPKGDQKEPSDWHSWLNTLPRALNQLLPKDIHVKKARCAADGFHARYDARGKFYRYTISLGTDPILSRHTWELNYPLELETMRQGAELFVGEHNLLPFCHLRLPMTRRSDSRAGCVTIFQLTVRRRRSVITGTPLLQIGIHADRFLYKMARRIVGALVDVARGKFPLDELHRAIIDKPQVQFQTAPARGLLLVRAYYALPTGWSS